MPASGRWWEDRSKMIGIVEHTDGFREWVSEYAPAFKGVREVVLIDGLFMAADVTQLEHNFDEEFKGFHFYDLSWVIPNYLDGANVGVVTDIRILHKSIGVTNQQWELNRQQFVKKWGDELPIVIDPPYKDFNIINSEEPKVSVIIPTKNNLKYIENNLYSWRNIVKYNNYEIIIADTGSDQDVINAYKPFLGDKVKLVRYDYYNFAKINNDVVRNYVSDETELVLFCNDDIYLLNDALSRMVQIYNENKENVGTIGIRLHYGDGSVQHNGIMIVRDPEGNIRLGHKDFKRTSGYDMGVNMNSKGNTGGFMLIKKDLFNELGGFNENYIECLEDVELNLKCRHQGLKNITVSDAVAFHYVSVSRNKIAGGSERLAVDFERLNVFIKDNQIKI
jgi:GT2 family glycosyltransferase